MNTSLTEAQSYTHEARRAEETANRLEKQASYFEGNSATGSLNLSQAYREWGLGEIERNRDYYGQARFDDISFQLSAQGQELQARFIEQYADKLHDDIADDLVLVHGKPVSRTNFSSPSIVRRSAPLAPVDRLQWPKKGVDVQTIGAEVEAAQAAGRKRLSIVKSHLGNVTKGAKGANAEAADDVKEW